jgi:acyl dehydratase
MAIDYDRLMAFPIPPTEHTYTERDTMLYALAVGFGRDPMDPRELAFVLERTTARADGLMVVPTMATVIAWNDRWLWETGIDMTTQVHGEQRITLHRPLPAAATVVEQTRIVEVFDKGRGKGAVMLFETEIRDKASGVLLATNLSTSVARGEGGFGGPSGSGPPPHPIPGRPPDRLMDVATHPNQALLYRLCGDRNPLHADPAVAGAGGFPRPILHGLCTLGHACGAVLRMVGEYEAPRVREIAVRFTAPVFPGDTIRTEMWRADGVVSFRSRVGEREVVVLDHGKIVLV